MHWSLMNLKDRVLRLGAYNLMPHFTVGVLAVVRDDDGAFLMVRSGIRQVGAWGFPGGFVRRRETPEMSLARELEEEALVRPHGHRFVATYKQPWARHYDMVLAVEEFSILPGPRKSRREVLEFDWFTVAQIADLEHRTRETEYFMTHVGLTAVGG